MRKRLDWGMVFRVITAVLLAGAAFGLFLLNRAGQKEEILQPREVQKDLSSVAAEMDQQVDTILARFKIEKSWSRKQRVAIPGTGLYRTERRVLIPPDVQPVQMNVAFNRMARKYDGRAIASENIKENLVTIHIELEQYIIQTIILKPVKDLKRGEANRRKASA